MMMRMILVFMINVVNGDDCDMNMRMIIFIINGDSEIFHHALSLVFFPLTARRAARRDQIICDFPISRLVGKAKCISQMLSYVFLWS